MGHVWCAFINTRVFIQTGHTQMSFQTVNKFESLIADFYGAPYAVAVDCCTHAIELCLRMVQPEFVTVPKHTYISVPMTFTKLNLAWDFTHSEWKTIST